MSPKILATRAAIVLAISLSVGAGQQPNPLVEAVKRADQDRTRVAELLRQRVDPNSADAYGSTALHWAAELDDLLTVQLLLKAGANPKALNRYGVAPLTLASTNGNAAIIGALLAAGADANTTAPGGETALMTASRTGNIDAVTTLVRTGADVNARDSVRGQTALMWAAAEGHSTVIQALVEAGADIDARSRRPGAASVSTGSRTAPTQVAVNRPMPDFFVRSNGGPLNTPMAIDSMSPLMFAVRAGRLDAVRALLDGGANVNETASNGLSELVLATINAHYELAAFLLDTGANPNAAGQGWTALHQVVVTPRFSYGRFPHPPQTGRVSPLALAKKLIERGADVSAHDCADNG